MDDAERGGLFADVSSWNWIHWTGLVLSICIAGINIFIGVTEGQSPFLIVGVSFLLGVLLFATRFWDSILYLLGVLHVAILGVLWVLDGMRFFAFGVATGLLSLALAVIALYLFYVESSSGARSNGTHRSDRGGQ